MFMQSLARAIFQPCNREPPLNDLLADPIVKLLMSSDRVQTKDLERLLQSAKRHKLAA